VSGGWLAVAVLAPLLSLLVGERLGRRLQERDRRTREHAVLESQRMARDISGRIREHSQVQSVLREAVVGLGEALALDRVVVQLAAGGRLQPAAQWASPDHAELSLDDPLLTTTLDGDMLSRLSAGRSVVVDDAGRDPAHFPAGPGLAQATSARSLVVTPLVSGGELLAVLTSLSSSRRRPFTGPEVQLLESVAWSLGRALQNRQIEEQQTALLQRLRELDRSKSEFVSSVSHELRTPLTSIAGYLEMLRDGDAGQLSAEQQDMLEIISRNAARLQSLIEDLLVIGRIESGAVELEQVRVDMGAVLADLPAAMAPLAQSAGLRLDVRPVPPGAEVIGDPAKLEQVVLNVTSNAVKFTPAGGSVTVEVTTGPDTVSVVVTDTGIGIPADERARLFGRFFRASNATARATQGAGLGLSIAQGIVRAHNGEIEVESQEGRGTTVRLRLPRAGTTAATREQTGARARL
jgi:signal transduction histidine kinase